ncbi:MAG: MFS transporter [Micromonosporaceae bacterium]|nr:MFS transporter [Micromonosporaceae bacterium]
MTAVTRSRTAVRARAAVSLVFGIHGVVQGTFATRIPWIADHVGAEPGGLGLALLFSSFGAIGTMPFTARLVHHLSPRVVIPAFLVPWCLVPVLAAQAPSIPLLCAALFVLGAAAGSADVAMNAQGVVVEQAYGRSIMSSLHGMWSVGGLAGAGVGVLAAHADIPAPAHFLAVGLVLTVGALVASPWLMDGEPAPQEDVPVFALPPRPVLLIALVGFAAIFGEAASTDWAALYLTDVAHASAAIGAAAYGGFAATMALARLVGDRLVNRFGAVRTVRLSGAAATAGALLVAVARSPVPAIAGFVLIGIGVAVAVPLAFAAAGKAGPRPAHQIAGVATIVYGAGLAAPATVGGVAHATSLSVSFLVVAALAAFIIAGAGALRPPDEADRPAELDPS